MTGTKGQPVTVDEGKDLPLAAASRPELSTAEPADSLNDWNNGRSDSIVADNSITQQIDADPASQTADPNGLQLLSFLGVPVMGIYSSPYGSSILPSRASTPCTCRATPMRRRCCSCRRSDELAGFTDRRFRQLSSGPRSRVSDWHLRIPWLQLRTRRLCLQLRVRFHTTRRPLELLSGTGSVVTLAPVRL